MKRNILITTMLFAAGTLLAADPKDNLAAAVKKLGDAANYSWKTTTANANDNGGGGGGRGGFGGGPVEGQASKDGWMYRKTTFGDNSFETVMKGTNGAFNGQDGWVTFEEMAQQGGGGFGGGRGGGMARFNQSPVAQLQDLLKLLKDVKEAGGAFTADLTDDGAKAQLNFGGGRRGGGGGGGGGPQIDGAKASLKVWVKDGVVTRYELKAKGTMTFNDNPTDIDRTTTTEFSGIGTTKVNVPDEVKKKLS